MIYDAVIIGAGACGLMCGVQASMQGKKVLILEKNDRPGAKILISGGGRCNYTNLYTRRDNFISKDILFADNILKQWTVDDTIDFFEAHAIYGKEKTLGQLFPAGKNAKDVVAMFLVMLQKSGTPIKLNCDVLSVDKKPDETFEIEYDKGGKTISVLARNVVMASGGLPISKLGASDFALRIARKYGLEVVKTAPALVPLTITGKEADWFAALSGNSVYCEVSNAKISFRENILFTHWGLSGPAILQISSYWEPGEEITIDLLPEHSVKDIIQKEREQGGRRLLSQVLQGFFTKKFSEALGRFLPVNKKIASLSKAEALLVETVIHKFTVKPAGDKGYNKAEVMRGGVATNELNPDTLESIKVKGLYFGGECVDVTGWLGGYNFQWAWASGVVIARNIQ